MHYWERKRDEEEKDRVKEKMVYGCRRGGEKNCGIGKEKRLRLRDIT